MKYYTLISMIGILFLCSCDGLLDVEENKNISDKGNGADATGFVASININDNFGHSTEVQFGLHPDATFGDGSAGETEGQLDTELGEIEMLDYCFAWTVDARWTFPTTHGTRVNLIPFNSDTYSYKSTTFVLYVGQEIEEHGYEEPYDIIWEKSSIPGLLEAEKNPDGRTFTFVDGETMGEKFSINMKTGEYTDSSSILEVIENGDRVVIRCDTMSTMSEHYEIICK